MKIQAKAMRDPFDESAFDITVRDLAHEANKAYALYRNAVLLRESNDDRFTADELIAIIQETRDNYLSHLDHLRHQLIKGD